MASDYSEIVVVDLIESVVESMRDGGETPYYFYGHPKEIVNTLSEYARSRSTRDKKFPLIALFQDFEENVNEDLAIYATANLRLIIANATEPIIKAKDRYERNFRDILYPIYYDFMNKLHASGYFNTTSPKTIPHTKIDRLYWGTQGTQGNENNLMNDYIDAIEIDNLTLEINDTRCKF